MSEDIRCLHCGRLLGKIMQIKGDASITLAIKCKCKSMNIKIVHVSKNVMQTPEKAL